MSSGALDNFMRRRAHRRQAVRRPVAKPARRKGPTLAAPEPREWESVGVAMHREARRKTGVAVARAYEEALAALDRARWHPPTDATTTGQHVCYRGGSVYVVSGSGNSGRCIACGGWI